MGPEEMEETGGLDTAHVTIYFVPPSSATDEQGNVSRKRKRSLEPGVVPLGGIRVDTSRLRQCSKYFETCMSGRWTGGQAQREFHLEVQTDVKYYKDCFTRIRFPFKPIESVTDCIELFKVASQIQYDHVLDNCERYLAAVPWSDEQEMQIREFYDSGQIFSDPASDLCKRLQLALNKEERMQSHLNLTERVLRRSLELSSTALLYESRQANLKLFRDGFSKAVKAGNSEVLQIALSTVMGEVERIFDCIKKAYEESQGPEAILHKRNRKKLLPTFFYLFELLRWGDSAQVIVEFLLKDRDISTLLRSEFQFIAGDLRQTVSEKKRWARMMRTIFEDVLEGRLFLTTLERLALFQRWIWLLKADNFKPDAALSATFVFDFILTFPQEEQEEIFRCWVRSLGDPTQQAAYDLSEIHSPWMKHLISKAKKLKCST